MPFIDVVPEAEATGDVARMYDASRAAQGYVPNYDRLFSHRPEVMAAWEALSVVIRGNLGTRRYRLVTLAAARELQSSYCLLAHGRVFLGEGGDEATLAAIATGAEAPALTPAERAIMAFAAKVVRDATAITPADVETLRAHGLDDAAIFDVTTAAAVRCFFSKTLDALGAAPDRDFRSLPEHLLAALTPGRAPEA